jgi:hypothetical protein
LVTSLLSLVFGPWATAEFFGLSLYSACDDVDGGGDAGLDPLRSSLWVG